MDKLQEYQNKRDFTKSGEPVGKINKKSKAKSLKVENLKDEIAKKKDRIINKADTKEKLNQKNDLVKTELKKINKPAEKKEKLKFVVQHHIATRDHFDFRLEWQGVLLSWAVPKGPSFCTKDKRLAVEVEPHPIEYKSFEGTIPKGEYGGGTVMLWDEGFYEPIEDMESGLINGSIKFVLKGKRLFGKWTLVRLKDDKKSKQPNWLLIKENDEFTKPTSGISNFTTSIKTNRTMQEITNGIDKSVPKSPFNSATLCLATQTEIVPEGDDWIYEIKYDGYRMLAFIDSDGVVLKSRNKIDYTKTFNDITKSLSNFVSCRQMVLDGEVAVLDSSGKTDFQALQSYVKKPNDKNITYIIFDILALDGKDLRGKPLSDRKKILADLFNDTPNNIVLSSYLTTGGKSFFKAVCSLGLEGVVCKKLSSTYSGERTKDWLKVKCDNRQEFIICGYTVANSKSVGISSLLLGAFLDGELIYVGRAGTGFTEKTSVEIETMLKKITQSNSPFKDNIKPNTKEKICWTKLKYIAEIKFAEITEKNILRQASFKGLREDKKVQEVELDFKKQNSSSTKTNLKSETDSNIKLKTKALKIKKTENIKDNKQIKKSLGKSSMATSTVVRNKKTATISGVEISSPDKIVFEKPLIKKLEVAEYYLKVSKQIFKYAGGRVLSLVKCPSGIAGQCFFKKHIGADSKGVEKILVDNDKDYFYINDSKGFLKEAQMGAIEFHIWGSKVETIDKPDMMVFDLDPDEGMNLTTVRQGVKDLKSILDGLNLKSYIKTSGGKGYHVVVPFKDVEGWEKFSDFSKKVAEIMEQKWPTKYTSNMRKEKRKGRIFIDWVRNGKGATSVAPYSLRAREGAKVSAPISWSELDKIAPDDIDIYSAVARLKKADPWVGFNRVTQSLN